jgi:hypothetical protein
MPRISKVRQTLQSALIATNDPAERIQLAEQLNRLIAQEERINGRARRARAKREAEAARAEREKIGRPPTEAELALPFEL